MHWWGKPALRVNGFQLSMACSLFSEGFRVQDMATILHVGCTFLKKVNQVLQRDFNCKLSSWTRDGVAKQGTWMVCLLISFERSGKLTNKIPYQLIVLPFLCTVSKWCFTHKEYNKQYLETYSDEIQEWIDRVSINKIYLCLRFDNYSIFIDVFNTWASPG